MGEIRKLLDRPRGRRGGWPLSLRARVAVFRELLHANNQALGFITRSRQALAAERPTTAREVQRPPAGASAQTSRMITNLACMSGEKQPRLVKTFARLREAMTRRGEVTPALVATRQATERLPAGREVTVDADARVVYQGRVEAVLARAGERLCRLVSQVPIDCRGLDLGGAVRDGVPAGEITLTDVTSRPLRALWRGMTDPGVGRNVTKPMSFRGFASAMGNYSFDRGARLCAVGEPSYAFASAEYLNLNSRIGHRFSTWDANVTERAAPNDASLRFVGGSTGIDQGSWRAELSRLILAEHGLRPTAGPIWSTAGSASVRPRRWTHCRCWWGC